MEWLSHRSIPFHYQWHSYPPTTFCYFKNNDALGGFASYLPLDGSSNGPFSHYLFDNQHHHHQLNSNGEQIASSAAMIGIVCYVTPIKFNVESLFFARIKFRMRNQHYYTEREWSAKVILVSLKPAMPHPRRSREAIGKLN